MAQTKPADLIENAFYKLSIGEISREEFEQVVRRRVVFAPLSENKRNGIVARIRELRARGLAEKT